eukprot:7313419-Prymnesium_polylepis.1
MPIRRSWPLHSSARPTTRPPRRPSRTTTHRRKMRRLLHCSHWPRSCPPRHPPPSGASRLRAHPRACPPLVSALAAHSAVAAPVAGAGRAAPPPAVPARA